jgi:hypothetical protein
MAGLLDLLSQIMPGPSKNPYGGLLSDDQYQQYRQQQLRQGIGRMGDFFMRASMGDSSGGRGGGGQGGLLDMMRMQQYQQAQQGQQREEQKDARWAEQFGGYDPTSGIDWKAGRPGSAPGLTSNQRQQLGLLGRERGEGLLAAQAFQKPDTLSPEAEAQKIRMAQAGRAPPMPDRQLVEIYDPNSPTGTRMVPRSEAAGQPGKPPFGFKMDFDDQGRMISMSQGRTGMGARGLTKSNRTYINKQIMAGEAALERLDTIKASWKPEWNTLEKRAELKWAALREKAFGEELSPEIARELAAYSQGSSNAISHVNQVIKDITGAQMSAAEAKRLRLPEPDPGEGIWPHDSPTEFAAKLDARYKAIEKANARYRYYTQKGVYNVDTMAGKSPLDSMKVAVHPETGERIIVQKIGNSWIVMQ